MQNTNEKMDVNSRRIVGEMGEPCESAKEFSNVGPAGEPAAFGLTSTSATAAMLEAVTQEVSSIYEDMNERRKGDEIFLNRIREKLLAQVDVIMQGVEQELYNNYEKINVEIKTEVDKLYKTLQTIERVQSEIDNFKSALASLYKDVVVSSSRSD